MSINKEAVAELVAYQIPNAQIGEAFGVTGQYIANLVREDEALQDMIREKAVDIAVRQHNNKVSEEQIEHDLLQKIKSQIDLSDSLIESVKALQLMKDIQGKGRALAHGAAAEGAAPGTTINLNLGETAKVSIQRNGSNEIINIAGRDMAPMPAKRIIEAARERSNGTAERDEGEAAEASFFKHACTDAL